LFGEKSVTIQEETLGLRHHKQQPMSGIELGQGQFAGLVAFNDHFI